MSVDPNVLLRSLIDAWCERRAYLPLATILPAWTSNTGLTDGWGALRAAVRSTLASAREVLSAEELELLRDVERVIDQIVSR